MYKVVVVDDEMVVRVGLKSFVDWESLGYIYAGEAGNGIDALALCRKIKPDVVLADIRMPKMDGIEFLKQLLSEQPKVKIIILSCIDEFDTLQDAVKLGIMDYFLKLSFSPEQLVVILNKFRIELGRGEENGTGADKPDSERDIITARENYYKSLVAGQVNKVPIPTDKRISAFNEKAFMLLFSKDQRYEGHSELLHGASRKMTIINLITEILTREFKCDVVEIEPDLFMAICENKAIYNFNAIYTNAYEIQNSLIRMMNYSVSVAVSLCADCRDNFYVACCQCKRALRQKFYEGHKSIIFYNEKMEQESDCSAPSGHIENKIQNWLDYFEFEKARQIVLELLDQIMIDRKWDPDDFRNYFPEIIEPWYKTYKRFHDGLPDKEITNPYTHMEHWETIEDLRGWFDDYDKKIELFVNEKLKLAKVRPEIEQAKKYIEDHYNKDINVNLVANLIGFNSSYFSHLFKKETGQGFSDYLMKVRLTKALNHLKETSYNINQISEMVGYNDVVYFRKQFRQLYHKSPSKFRNND